jgi:hypothetical protein
MHADLLQFISWIFVEPLWHIFGLIGLFVIGITVKSHFPRR